MRRPPLPVLFVMSLSLGLLTVASAAEPDAAPWSQKPVASWTEKDAEATLSNSPWAKSTTPDVQPRRQQSSNGMGRGGGRRGGIGGIPGIGGIGGIGRGGGMGRGGGGGSRRPVDNDSTDNDSRRTPPNLVVRWESAEPIQAAHLKAGESTAALSADHYRLTVANVPRRLFHEDPRSLEKKLKTKGELRREGQKPMHSTSARVLEQENGLLLIFDFPRKYEIVNSQKRVDFAVHLDNVTIDQPFSLNEMMFNGKLAL